MAENQETNDIEKTAEEYFEYVKSKKQTLTNEFLKTCLSNMASLATKYQKTKQVRSLKKLKFLTEVLVKEEELLNLGVDSYIYRQDIETYLNCVTKNTVKIIELGNYTREIPDDAIEVIEKTEKIFDKFYIIYTDYTGREERRVEEEKKSRDPILFGVFEHSAFVADRFYVLADWVDEYCDLTLDKMVAEMKEAKPDIKLVKTEIVPQTSEELLEVLKNLEATDSSYSNFQVGNGSISIVSGTSPQFVNMGDSEISGVDAKGEKEPMATIKKESLLNKFRNFFKKND